MEDLKTRRGIAMLKPISIPMVAIGKHTWGLGGPVKLRLSASSKPLTRLYAKNKVPTTFDLSQVRVEKNVMSRKGQLALLVHGMICRATDEMFACNGGPPRQVKLYLITFMANQISRLS